MTVDLFHEVSQPPFAEKLADGAWILRGFALEFARTLVQHIRVWFVTGGRRQGEEPLARCSTRVYAVVSACSLNRHG